MYCRIGVYN